MNDCLHSIQQAGLARLVRVDVLGDDLVTQNFSNLLNIHDENTLLTVVLHLNISTIIAYMYYLLCERSSREKETDCG